MLLVIEFCFRKEGSHPDNTIHRRTDFMAHNGEEGPLGFVGLFSFLSCPHGVYHCRFGLLHGNGQLFGSIVYQLF